MSELLMIQDKSRDHRNYRVIPKWYMLPNQTIKALCEGYISFNRCFVLRIRIKTFDSAIAVFMILEIIIRHGVEG